jgi:hypothetical protein
MEAQAAVSHALNRVTEEIKTVQRIAAGETLWQAHDIERFYGNLGIEEKDAAWDDGK